MPAGEEHLGRRGWGARAQLSADERWQTSLRRASLAAVGTRLDYFIGAMVTQHVGQRRIEGYWRPGHKVWL